MLYTKIYTIEAQHHIKIAIIVEQELSKQEDNTAIIIKT